MNPAKVRGLICNPIYAGVPPYPAVVSEEQWVAAAARMIEEDGVEQFLVNMLYVLREAMAVVHDEGEAE
jgi:hypothetical protein